VKPNSRGISLSAQRVRPQRLRRGGFLSIQVRLPEKPYSQPQQRQRFAQQLISRIKAFSEVEFVAAGSSPPDGYDRRGTVTEGLINKSEILTYQAVTPEYSDVLKLNLSKGRLFEERDRRLDVRLMIVSESVARKLFEDRGLDPIGKGIHLYDGPKKGPPREVIGVVSDAGMKRERQVDPATDCRLTECIYIIVN
jgi:MacB-like protein